MHVACGWFDMPACTSTLAMPRWFCRRPAWWAMFNCQFSYTHSRAASSVGAVSTLAGLVTTTVTAPVDMIKTRMFVDPQRYPTPGACVRAVVQQAGVSGLFRGWGAQWARQGPMTTVIFVVNEWLRHAMGMESM